MISKDDIEHLANLARMDIADEEKEAFAQKIAPVLAYVGEIASVSTKEAGSPSSGILRNVMRDDTHPHEGGHWSGAILKNAPAREGDFFRVKQMF